MITDQHRERLDWIARLYSHNEEAVSDEIVDEQLFDRHNDFGMKTFLDTFRPLQKLREERGPVRFHIENVAEDAPDLVYADLCVDGEIIFVARIRFEEEAPHRIKYWSSYPPLAEGVVIREYTPADAAGCVALEQLCPMESADGTRWTIDRGSRFDDYLQLMGPIDAAVVEVDDEIVGFFSCALRPIRFNNEECFAVYQHHYRVHPEHRSGRISVALASQVDPRRTFDNLPVVFPYSLVDPDNLHMQDMSFPPVNNVRIARLALPIEGLVNADIKSVELERPEVGAICRLMNATHSERELFPLHDDAYLESRWSRIASFDVSNYHCSEKALVALWNPQERNIIEKDGATEVRRYAFALDYAFAQPDDLLQVLKSLATSLKDSATTHICVMCDTRAPEYSLFEQYSDNESQLAVHTLPWICEPLEQRTMFCDGIYC